MSATPVSFRELLMQAKAEVTLVSADEAARQICLAGERLLLDVREPDEYARESLPGAANLPRGLLEFKIEALCPDRDRPILVHCASGGRAVLAARTLQDMGYSRVAAVDGSFAALQTAIG